MSSNRSSGTETVSIQVSISPESPTLIFGRQGSNVVQMSASLYPSEYEDGEDIEWTCSPSGIVSIYKAGPGLEATMTAAAVGDVTITATAVNAAESASTQISCKEPPPDGAKIKSIKFSDGSTSKTINSLTEGDPFVVLEAKVEYTGAIDDKVVWESSKPSVIAINTLDDATCACRPLEAGTAVVTGKAAMDSSKTITCTFTVRSPAVYYGDQYQFDNPVPSGSKGIYCDLAVGGSYMDGRYFSSGLWGYDFTKHDQMKTEDRPLDSGSRLIRVPINEKFH